METKLIVVLIALNLMVNVVVGDFFFNHPAPKADEINGSPRYICVPGRTTIKVTEKKVELVAEAETDSDEFRLRNGPTRKKHMNVPTQDEYCRVCVCSAEGKDEYCSNRPAANINECIMLQSITNRFNTGQPFELTRDLSNSIRRDYIWHNDEIPYNSKAKCFRGHSYYTNSLTAKDTDIDIGTDVESLLDYSNEDTCFYCVCSASGVEVGCINREVSFCNFFRVIRDDKHVRDRYTSLMQQDRPTYFRQLSWRLRRTMDNGVYEMLDAVNHVGEPYKRKCIPLISEYTDCNEDNICTGCSRCKCDVNGQWDCQEASECPSDDTKSPDVPEEDNIFDDALQMLDSQMKLKKLKSIKVSASPQVPAPSKSTEQEDLLAPFREKPLDKFLADYRLSRVRRSTADTNKKHSKRSVVKSHTSQDPAQNNTLNHYDAIDEINEDTLKDSNLTGTLVAKKMEMKQPTTNSRRSSFADKSKALHTDSIHHITDNKIETTEQEVKFDASHENLKVVLGNFTQTTKNKDLSKIVVSELKKSSETIGDASASPVSSITFTPDNDTLTAMAYIAGNLLNKLWNMEKDAGATSTETDSLKHEKIADLLELFKEPLNMRQEVFLKNALEQLSTALEKNKDTKNISICATINESEKLLNNNSSTEEETPKLACRKNAKHEDHKAIKAVKDLFQQKNSKMEMTNNQKEATLKAIAKINNVLELIKKFENVQSNLSVLQHGPKFVFNNTLLNKRTQDFYTKLSEDEENSFNLFGNVLDKITKLILPKRNNKKIANGIKSQNVLKDDDNLKKKLKKMYNVDISNMTLSAKDKMILDYLTHVDNNPDCLLKSKTYKAEAVPSIEGNILLNLSEFFKLKSFGDLIKLIEPEQLRTSINQAEKQTIETTTKGIEENYHPSSNIGVDSAKLKSTKDKLKAHLKTIMEDLIEIQSARGTSFKENIKITDALPCIYNLLKEGTEIEDKKEENVDPMTKISNIFIGLKTELKNSFSRRNAGDILTERPKSAVIWERVVKNLNNKSPSNTRRSSISTTPKSYEQIKKTMDRIENASSTYKHHALLVKTPAAGKLILLKALDQEVQAAINVMGDITQSFDNLSKLPTEKFAELEEFIGNLATGINLSKKVNEKVKMDVTKLSVKTESQPEQVWDQTKQMMTEISNNKMLKTNFNKKPVLASDPSEESDGMKISRIQIMNQLIRNRVKMFLKLKEEGGADFKHDMTYNIAQRILYYLDTGNFNLANELFRLFAMQKQDGPTNDGYIAPSTPSPMRRMAQQPTEPPVLLEDPNKLKAKHQNWATQDHLIKQLLNIKNMGL